MKHVIPRRGISAFCCVAIAACHTSRLVARPEPAVDIRYEAMAVRFATLAGFRARSLIADADSARRIDIAMMVWALRAPTGKIVLIDAGFHRDRFIAQWKPRDYQTPAQALQRAGILADDVTDVIVTHIHWDHADGVDLFPNARIWLQADEFNYYVGPAGEPLHQGIDAGVSVMFRQLQQRGRLELVSKPDAEILPGIRVHTGGKHTFASQFVSVRTASGTVVFASDNAYLYENIERRVPIAQTLDAASNVRAQGHMLELAAQPRLVVPGHDPAVFTRFPLSREGVAVIR